MNDLSHVLQLSVCAIVLYLPGAQSVQNADLAVAYFPGEHSTQLSLPSPAYFPTAQSLQSLFAGASCHCPHEHSAHTVLPSEAAYLPTTQGVHAVASESELENFPALQMVHLVLPVDADM